MNNKNEQNEIAEKLGLNKSKKSKIFGRIVGLIVLIAVILGIYFFLQNKKSKETETHYTTKPITIGNITVTVNATGSLEPLNEVEVGCEVSGTLKTVEVDYNDHVKVNQVLARIDTSKLDAEVQEYEAGLKAAEAEQMQQEATLKEAQSQLTRLKKVYELSNGKVPSIYELEAQEATVSRAEANVASAKAGVSKAEASLKVSRTDLEKAVIVSPINGIVLTKSVEAGQTITASMETPELFTLAESLTQLELQVDVDEADVGQVKEGQKASFTVDAYPEKSFPAEITQVRFGSTTTDGVVTYTTILKVNNDDLSLLPGMTATAVIITQEVDDTLLVPSSALRFTPPKPPEHTKKVAKKSGSLISSLIPQPPRREGNGQHPEHEGQPPKLEGKRIFVLKDGHPYPIPIVTGMTDGINTEVIEGDVEEGMEVIIDMTTGTE